MTFKAVTAFTLLSGLALAPGAAAPEPPSLRLLARATLPPARSVATDVRWAGDDSVYVSWYRDGVAELGLDGVRRRALVPKVETLNGLEHYDHLAVNSGDLAVAAKTWALARRPLRTKRGGEFSFELQKFRATLDFDISDHSVVLIGVPKGEPFAPRGEIAWFGDVRSSTEDLRPVLRDLGGPGAPSYFNCGTYDIGAVRFLADGSFVIAPGFQDGIHLFDREGRKVRTWTNAEVGVDSQVGCAEMTSAEETKLRVDDDFYQRRLNGRRTIDEILPLPQGPGLLVRSWGADHQAHWVLRVLGKDRIDSYELPIAGRRPFDRLHGDVRNGKIVLLLSNSGYSMAWRSQDLPAEIFLMEMPKLKEEP